MHKLGMILALVACTHATTGAVFVFDDQAPPKDVSYEGDNICTVVEDTTGQTRRLCHRDPEWRCRQRLHGTMTDVTKD